MIVCKNYDVSETVLHLQILTSQYLDIAVEIMGRNWILNAGCFLVSVSPYLMYCPIPSSHANMRPVSVSLVEEMCETSTNYLNIIYNLPTGEKEKFAVCVKGLDFPMEDRSVRLVEWIEATMNLPPQIYYSYHDIHIRIDKICCFCVSWVLFE